MLLHLPFTFIISVCSLTYTHTDMQLCRLEKTKCLRRSHEGVFKLLSVPMLHSSVWLALGWHTWETLMTMRAPASAFYCGGLQQVLGWTFAFCPFLTHYDTALVTNSSRGWVQHVRKAVRALQVAPSSVGRWKWSCTWMVLQRNKLKILNI